jgi:hypothetical protein
MLEIVSLDRGFAACESTVRSMVIIVIITMGLDRPQTSFQSAIGMLPCLQRCLLAGPFSTFKTSNLIECM